MGCCCCSCFSWGKSSSEGDEPVSKSEIAFVRQENPVPRYSVIPPSVHHKITRETTQDIVENHEYTELNELSPDKSIFVAIEQHEGTESGFLSLKTGDRMELLRKETSSAWYVCKLKTGEKGLVPVAKIAHEDWYFWSYSREEASNCLRNHAISIGAFMVRPRSSRNKGFAMSVKQLNEKTHMEEIHHYKIVRDGENGLYLVNAETKRFASLQQLVSTYVSYPTLFKLPQTGQFPLRPVRPLMMSKNVVEIDRRELKLCRQISESKYVTVSSGTWNNIQVAVHVFKPNNNTLQNLQEGASLLTKARHENVVSILGICSRSEPFLILSEYARLGNLRALLRSERGLQLQQTDLLKIAQQITNGMQHLAECRIVHRNLCAQSILLEEGYKVRIGSFGSAARSDWNTPVRWSAPEVLSRRIFSTKSDVWSFGVLVTELFTDGKTPYADLEDSEVRRKVLDGYRMERPHNSLLPQEIYDLSLRCWETEPRRRPTFSYLFNYFRQMLHNPDDIP